MNFAAISLVVLAVVVAIGFIKEVNLGFLSLGAAFVLGCNVSLRYGFEQWHTRAFLEEGCRTCRKAHRADPDSYVCSLSVHLCHRTWPYRSWHLADNLRDVSRV